MSAIRGWSDKGADDTLDYVFDWTQWLAGDSIASCSVTCTGVTVASHSNTANKVTCWLSGGTAGQSYEVACSVTTTVGRVAKRYALLAVVA